MWRVLNDNLKNNIKKNPSAYGITGTIKVVRSGQGDESIDMSDNGLTDYDINHYILQITGAPSKGGGYVYGSNHHQAYVSGFTPSLTIDAENDTLAISSTSIQGYCGYDSKIAGYKATTTCTWKLWHIE